MTKRNLIDSIKSTDVLPDPPFRQIIVGASTSGKTNLLINFLLYFYNGVFERIYIFSPTFYKDELWRAIHIPPDRVKLGYEEEELKKVLEEIEEVEIDTGGECLIIFDDCGEDGSNKASQKNEMARMINTISHSNCSIFRLNQMFTQLDGCSLCNADMVHVFSLLRKQDVDLFHKNFGLYYPRQTIELLKDTTNTTEASKRKFLSVKRDLGKYIYFANLKPVDRDGYID